MSSRLMNELMEKNRKEFIWLLVGSILLWFLVLFQLYIAIPFAIWLTYKAIVAHYFTTDNFLKIRRKISKNTEDCNNLNDHIEMLKRTYLNYRQVDYGLAKYADKSRWNFRRPQLMNDTYGTNIYRCSLSVCRNASQQPFKYVMKYFNIAANEKVLEQFEDTLNNYMAAEQGKELLRRERGKIIEGISNSIPWYIMKFNKEKLYEKLGFNKIDFSQMYFPKYTFQYVSGGGNSSMRCDVIFDIENLNRFVEYLAGIIKFRKSVAGQRALMNSALREHIKERDNYTCRHCKNSIKKEPNLLLEIDHIVPLSRGGMTEEKNLQTLCWRCNRSKGTKVESSSSLKD